tara:strand:+ start:420 stop:839 length:420 start_codon:yes stop_codon:yes gene_type:complete
MANEMVLHYETDDLDGAVYITVQYGEAFQSVVGDGTLYDPYTAEGWPVYGWVGENYYPAPVDVVAPALTTVRMGERDVFSDLAHLAEADGYIDDRRLLAHYSAMLADPNLPSDEVEGLGDYVAELANAVALSFPNGGAR